MKNISKSNLGDKVGRIHMKKQNLDKMGGRKISALRKGNKSSTEDVQNAEQVSAKKQKTRWIILLNKDAWSNHNELNDLTYMLS